LYDGAIKIPNSQNFDNSFPDLYSGVIDVPKLVMEVIIGSNQRRICQGGWGARAPPTVAEPVELPSSASPKFFCHWRMERRSLSVELRLKTMLER